MTLQHIIQNLPEKLQQAEWLAQGYAHGRHATLADQGRHIQAILDSYESLGEVLQDLAKHYSTPSHQGDK
jgi:hypothetical protein